jgi:hypothetical protein
VEKEISYMMLDLCRESASRQRDENDFRALGKPVPCR